MNQFQYKIATAHFDNLTTAKSQEKYIREIYYKYTEQHRGVLVGATPIGKLSTFMEHVLKTFDKNILPDYITATVFKWMYYSKDIF